MSKEDVCNTSPAEKCTAWPPKLEWDITNVYVACVGVTSEGSAVNALLAVYWAIASSLLGSNELVKCNINSPTVESWAIDIVAAEAVGTITTGASLTKPFTKTVEYTWWVSPPDPVCAP